MSEQAKTQPKSSVPRVKLDKVPARRVPITKHNEYVERWIHATARRNMWRVKHYYELEDLIQDGFLCWYKVCDKYADDVQRTKHLMGLFKTTFTNHIHRVARVKKTEACRLDPCLVGQGDDRGFVVVESSLGDILSRGQQAIHRQYSESVVLERLDDFSSLSQIDLDLVIAEAPELVQRVLKYLMSEEGCERLRKPSRILSDGSRETMNDRLCRIFDLDPCVYNLTAEVRNYLYDRLNLFVEECCYAE